jgi:hypothetical protein
VLLACLRYWAQIEGRTDAEVQAAIESADKAPWRRLSGIWPKATIRML